MRCMECDRPSLNLLEFLGKIFLPLVRIRRLNLHEQKGFSGLHVSVNVIWMRAPLGMTCADGCCC